MPHRPLMPVLPDLLLPFIGRVNLRKWGLWSVCPAQEKPSHLWSQPLYSAPGQQGWTPDMLGAGWSTRLVNKMGKGMKVN